MAIPLNARIYRRCKYDTFQSASPSSIELAVPNQYMKWTESQRLSTQKQFVGAGYLVRQFVSSNLLDRISTRPFLTNIEKRWVAFQLLKVSVVFVLPFSVLNASCGKALEQSHGKDVRHGDLKSENILVNFLVHDYYTISSPLRF